MSSLTNGRVNKGQDHSVCFNGGKELGKLLPPGFAIIDKLQHQNLLYLCYIWIKIPLPLLHMNQNFTSFDAAAILKTVCMLRSWRVSQFWRRRRKRRRNVFLKHLCRDLFIKDMKAVANSNSHNYALAITPINTWQIEVSCSWNVQYWTYFFLLKSNCTQLINSWIALIHHCIWICCTDDARQNNFENTLFL